MNNPNLKHLVNMLSKFGNRYIDSNHALKRANVIKDVRQYNTQLLKILFNDDVIRQAYFKNIDGINIFEQREFIDAVRDAGYWLKSHTSFGNHVGLAIGDHYIDDTSDVVLDFPHKDCVLKGGMTKEETNRNVKERFYNDVISRPQIDQMFAPKIFSNVKKYDKDHLYGAPVNNFDINHDNLMIKANNLIALHSLLKQYENKVKLIYIDPPYNTGNDSFQYNDNFSQSTWLVFMENRLRIAKELLKDNGFIVIQTDDGEQAYLKVLMDEIFGRKHYLNTITIKTKSSSGVSGGGQDKRLKKNVEFLTVYANDLAQINTPVKKTPLSNYIQERKLAGKSFAYTQVMLNPGYRKYIGSTKDGRGQPIKLFKVDNYKTTTVKELSQKLNVSVDYIYNHYLNQIYTTENAQTSIRNRVKRATGTNDDYIIAEYRPVSGRNKNKLTDVGFSGKTKRLVSFIKNTAYLQNNIAYKNTKLGTLWTDISWSSIKSEGDINFNNGEKPEKLLQHVISMTTSPHDIVLDFFSGSATTQAVAMKMHRRFIGVEQMDYIDTVSVPRLKKVIKGEQGGISKSVNWHGGGSFIYATFLNRNQKFIELLNHAKTDQDLDDIYQKMKKSADIDFDFDMQKFEAKEPTLLFNKKYMFDQKYKSLLNMLDKNQLYYNYADIDDANVRNLPGLSNSDYQFNKSFYKGGDQE